MDCVTSGPIMTAIFLLVPTRRNELAHTRAPRAYVSFVARVTKAWSSTENKILYITYDSQSFGITYTISKLNAPKIS